MYLLTAILEGKYPILILHGDSELVTDEVGADQNPGLFQSSGSFITSEERSIAFWLAERGSVYTFLLDIKVTSDGRYQVFLGNTRGVFNMGHKTLSRGDPRFWGV